MNWDVSYRLTYGSFLLHSHIWASSLFCLKVAVMSCLLGSLWNKGRPLRGSDAGAASSNCVRFRFLQKRRLQHSLEHPRALEELWVFQIQQSSLCSRLVFVSARGHRHRSPMTQRTDPLRARSPFSLSTLCLCFLVCPLSVLSPLLPRRLFLQRSGGGGGWWLASVLVRPQLSLDHLEYLDLPSGRAFPRQMVASPDQWLPREFHRVFSCFCSLDCLSRSFR